MKRFINGPLHGRWTIHWLQPLLDEFTFRFNRRRTRHRPGLFNRVLEVGATRRPPTRALLRIYGQIVDPDPAT